jgi:hypothetical protein
MAGYRFAWIAPSMAAVLLTAACSGPEEERAEVQKTPPQALEQAPPPPFSAVPEGGAVGGDGSPIRLSAVTPADLAANLLEGELGCSFSSEDGSRTLILAMGDVASADAAQGLVKVGDDVERISAPGGFNGMLKGAVFNGAGKTIRIALTGPARGGGESPPRPATLTYERADGASRTFEGTWTCGP